MKVLLCGLFVLVVATLVVWNTPAREHQLVRNWHPILIELALTKIGISWMGHDHDPNPPESVGGRLVSGPGPTTCFDYDFLELHCDGHYHFKALFDDNRVGAYKGDPSPLSPDFARACGWSQGQKYCVEDHKDDGKTVWRETDGNLERLPLEVGCPGPRSWWTPCERVIASL